MTQNLISTNDSLIPAPSLDAGAEAFSERIQGLLDGQPKDDATVARALEGMEDMVDRMAARMYNLASMMVGEGEDSISLVEAAIAKTEVSACQDAEQGRQNCRRTLSVAALEMLDRRNPGCLDAPERLEPAKTCIEDDDLDAAGVYGEELQRMFDGPDRQRVRNWLASLPTRMRVVFVLRAVAGFTSAETAVLLAGYRGPRAAEWSADAVREIFRQGLCSLASQLIHATTAR